MTLFKWPINSMKLWERYENGFPIHISSCAFLSCTFFFLQPLNWPAHNGSTMSRERTSELETLRAKNAYMNSANMWRSHHIHFMCQTNKYNDNFLFMAWIFISKRVAITVIILLLLLLKSSLFVRPLFIRFRVCPVPANQPTSLC